MKLHLWQKIILMIVLSFCSTSVFAESADKINTRFVKCNQPGSVVEEASIRKTLGFADTAAVAIVSDHECVIKIEEDLDYPAQIYRKKNWLAFRADIQTYNNKLMFSVTNQKLHTEVEAVHILYRLDRKLHKLMSFETYDGSGFRAAAWHFYGSEENSCPPYNDYVLVIQWKAESRRPHSAHQYRITNIPRSCGMGG